MTALWQLERGTRIGQLTGLGVPVISWQGSGSLNAALLALTRAATSSQVGGRRFQEAGFGSIDGVANLWRRTTYQHLKV